MNFLSSLIGPVTSLIGGLFGQSNQDKINQQNIQAQQAINAQNIAEQEKFAQNSIQWKVADAAKAGISPLAAIGAQGVSFSNVVAPQSQSSNEFGKGLADAGQNLSRAIEANSDRQQRIDDLNAKLLESKIANTNADTVRQQAEASAIAVKAHGATPAQIEPLYIKVRGDRGELVEIPNPKIATSLQTPASWPQQAAMALKAPFEMAADAAKYYSSVWDHATTGLVVPPYVRRALENFNNRDVVGY